MKTLDNGCPQFDGKDTLNPKQDKKLHEHINTKLREWHNSRRCLNCKHLVLQEPGFEDVAKCNKVLIWFYKTNGPDISTFSCQAFEEKK